MLVKYENRKNHIKCESNNMQPNDELSFSLTCPWQKRQLTQTGDQIHCEGWSEHGWTESKKRLMWKRRILLCSKWVYLIRSKQTPPENIDGKNIIFKLSEPCNQFGKSKWWWQYMRPLLNHMSVYRHRNPFMPPKICTFFGFSYGWRAAFSPLRLCTSEIFVHRQSVLLLHVTRKQWHCGKKDNIV